MYIQTNDWHKMGKILQTGFEWSCAWILITILASASFAKHVARTVDTTLQNNAYLRAERTIIEINMQSMPPLSECQFCQSMTIIEGIHCNWLTAVNMLVIDFHASSNQPCIVAGIFSTKCTSEPFMTMAHSWSSKSNWWTHLHASQDATISKGLLIGTSQKHTEVLPQTTYRRAVYFILSEPW